MIQISSSSSFLTFLLCVSLMRFYLLLAGVLGDTLIQQSVSLLHVKDPLFKRIGASRLSRFAIDGLIYLSCLLPVNLFLVLIAFGLVLLKMRGG